MIKDKDDKGEFPNEKTIRFVFENEVEQTEIYPDHKPKIIRFGKSRLPERNFDTE